MTGTEDLARPRHLDAELLVCLLVPVSLVLLAVGQGPLLLHLAGAGLATGSATYAVVMRRRAERSAPVVVGALGTLVGVAVAITPRQTLDVLTVAVGVAFIALGVWVVLRDVDERGGLRRVVTVGALFVPVGVALVVLADRVLTAGLWLAAAVIAAYGAVRLGQRLGVTRVSVPEGVPLLGAWVRGKGPRPEDAAGVEEKLFFEGEEAFSRSVRYALLMLFAAVISATGVLTDSTAVVIGAMLIAPLINPMMGMGLSLAMGWPVRLARSAVLVLVGTLIAVATGWLLAAAFNVPVDLVTNSQITSRSSPTLADLVVAVAAGAAGAYAMSRQDVASSLPGVAVAIALVPPLSVVGIAAEAGDWTQAAGTALLFLTNLTAILLVGGLVFVLTGIAPLPRTSQGQHRIAVAGGVTLVAAMFVVAALVVNSDQVVRDSLAEDEARRAVGSWLGDETAFTVVSLVVEDPGVVVVLAGPGTPPSAGALAADLADRLERPVRLDLQWIPRQREVVGSDPTR